MMPIVILNYEKGLIFPSSYIKAPNYNGQVDLKSTPHASILATVLCLNPDQPQYALAPYVS